MDGRKGVKTIYWQPCHAEFYSYKVRNFQVRERGSECEVGHQRSAALQVTGVHLPEPDVQQERLNPATLGFIRPPRLLLALCIDDLNNPVMFRRYYDAITTLLRRYYDATALFNQTSIFTPRGFSLTTFSS